MSANSEARRQKLEAAFLKLNFVMEPKRVVHLQAGVAALSQVNSEGSGKFPKEYEDEVARRKRGARKGVRANAVTTVTAYTFTQLTGRKPTLVVRAYLDDKTPTSPFFLLLVEVFETLGLKDDPEHSAKEFIKNVNRVRTEELLRALFLLMSEECFEYYRELFQSEKVTYETPVDTHPLAIWAASNRK